MEGIATMNPTIHKNTFREEQEGFDFVVFVSMALVRERTIPTERPPHVSEVSAIFSG
jgi:hypothetical protein